MKKNRIHKARFHRHIPKHMVKYKYAEEFADNISLDEHSEYEAIVKGNFIFGDFIEALIVKNNLHCEFIKIATLSFSQENVDSLRNLIVGDYVDKLDMLISSYQFSHERGKSGLIAYAYANLDIDDKFQLAHCRQHAKITLVKTHCGKEILIKGSANLRSSDCIEQLTISINCGSFGFYHDFIDELIEKYKTIG